MTAIDSKYEDMDDFTLADQLQELSGVMLPKAIQEIRTAPVRHNRVTDPEHMPEIVKEILGIQK